MDNVRDRIVQYANRYKLTNADTGEVLGTFDFDEVTGTVTAEGTPINKALFDSIAADLTANAEAIAAVDEKADTHIERTDNPHTVTKAQVGLGNVANERQYSASNPPPYPVTSVAGKTGAVTLAKSDVGLGNVDNTSDEDKPVSTATQTALNGKANTSGTYPNLTVGKATNADNTTKATQDASGNVITSTYATKKELNSGLSGKANTSGSYPNLTVGNAEKLGNKAASEYASASDIPDVSNFAEKTGTYSGMTVGNATNATNLIPDENGAVNPGGRGSGTVGANSTALGSGTTAGGENSTALGNDATASGINSIAIGRDAIAGYSGCVSIGNEVVSGSDSATSDDRAKNAIGIGNSALALDAYSVAIGGNTQSQMGGVAIGGNAQSRPNSVAIGKNTHAIVGSTALGFEAEALGSYSTAIGYGATVADIEQKTMQLGGVFTEADGDLQYNTLSVLRCPVNLTVTSDERDKADISDITNALAFLEKLNPVTFVKNEREKYISKADKESEKFRKYGMCEYDRIAHAAGTKKGERRRCGLLAQEVIAAMQEVYGTDNYANIVNDNFHDLKEKPSDVENKYTLAYANLVPFLIGAIKELNAEIKTLKDKLNDNN